MTNTLKLAIIPGLQFKKNLYVLRRDVLICVKITAQKENIHCFLQRDLSLSLFIQELERQ